MPLTEWMQPNAANARLAKDAKLAQTELVVLLVLDLVFFLPELNKLESR